MKSNQYDLIVIGAGVLGTFHAYHAAEAGKKVLLLEKDAFPVQATVRNFGQVVPSGMASHWFDYGVYSTRLYKKIQENHDLGIRQNGSVYIASDDDEQVLIHELKKRMDERGYEAHLLSPTQCLTRWPALLESYCREALFFPQEVSAEPHLMIYRLLEYCTLKFPKLKYRPSTTVLGCEISGGGVHITTNQLEKYRADKVIICNGSEFKILFSDLFDRSGIVVSKLQMLRTMPMPSLSLEGNILTGLTIRRYESFEECPAFRNLKTPVHLQKLKAHGIHILFKKSLDGSVIVGDSHAYAPASRMEELGFDTDQLINDLMWQEAARIADTRSWKIASTWAGYYSQHPEKDLVEIDLEDKVFIRTAIGGKGMTSSAGYAQKSIQQIFG